jgi:hypothetical protein
MYGDQPQPQPGAYGEPYRANPKNGLGIAAIIVAIIALLIFLIPVVGLVLGLVGLVLSIVALRRVKKGVASNRGVALGALIVSILAVVIGLVWTGLFVWGIAFAADNGGEEYTNCVARAGQDQVAVEACTNSFTNDILGELGIESR